MTAMASGLCTAVTAGLPGEMMAAFSAAISSRVSPRYCWWSRPVSYTHLVARGGRTFDGLCSVSSPSRFLTAVGEKAVLSLPEAGTRVYGMAAVSYTHLDVYKRQGLAGAGEQCGTSSIPGRIGSGGGEGWKLSLIHI